MARLRYLDREDLAEEDKRLLDRPANLFRLLVHSPDGYRNFARLGGWIRSGSTLDPRLREMAILQVGYLTSAVYEWTHHIELGRNDFGVSDDDIRAIVAETNGEGSALPEFDRAYPLVGCWMVGGRAAGLCIREDRNRVTAADARFVPHVILA